MVEAAAANTLLHRLFYNTEEPTAYTGSVRFLSEQLQRRLTPPITITRALELTQHWLEAQPAYTQFRRAVYRYPTAKTHVPPSVNYQWQLDLMDMFRYRDLNDGYRYILVAIDCLSRHVWLRPLRTKRSEEVASAFESILETVTATLPKPQVVHSDAGLEFRGAPFQQLLRNNNIRFFVSQSNFKAAIAERFIRTLKERLMRYFRARNGTRWFDSLEAFQSAYNNSPHRSLQGITPQQVVSNPLLLGLLWQSVQESIPDPTPRFRIGDLVRVQLWKDAFTKGFTDRWSREIYRVSNVLARFTPTMYIVEDALTENALPGAFNEYELQRVRVDEEDPTVFERVISVDRSQPRNWRYLVQWRDRAPYAPQWLAEKEIADDMRAHLRRVYRR